MRSGSTDGQFNSMNKEESSRQAVLRCYTGDSNGLTSKQCASKALFCGNRNKPRVVVGAEYYDKELSMDDLHWILDAPKI